MDVLATFDADTHPHYRRLLANLPPGARVASLPGEWGHPAGSPLATRAFWKARAAWHALGGPNVDRFDPRAVAGRPILAAQTFPLNRVPWALDVDTISALVGFRHRLVRTRRFRAFARARLRDPRLRAVTYWSRIARRGVEALFPEEADRLREASILLYPAVPPAPPRPEHDGDVEVLFVGRNLDAKGGPEAAAVARRVLDAHPKGVRFTFVTHAPRDALPDSPQVRVLSRVPQDELDALFRRADVLFFPTVYEVFGVVAVEALAHGTPVVGLDEYALPEVVEHGRDGFLVRGYAARWHDEAGVPLREFREMRALQTPVERERVVRELADAVEALVADPALRRRMGEAGRRKTLPGGPFSPEAQRSALERLFARIGRA